MDGDVQQQYLAAEQAYGEGDFEQAEAVATALLRRLDTTTSSGVEQEACLAWRAFVALLLGHIYFHGLHQADKAEVHYQLVLASTPPDTLRDLAQQGVERCRDLHQDPPTEAPSGTSTELRHKNTSASAIDLIEDPFLPSSGNAAIRAQTSHGSATPWLKADESTPPAAALSDTFPAANATTSAKQEPPKGEIQDPTTDDSDGDTPTTTNNEPITEAHVPLETENSSADALAERSTPSAASLDLGPWLLRRAVRPPLSRPHHN